jgi:predicted dehydrogenase
MNRRQFLRRGSALAAAATAAPAVLAADSPGKKVVIGVMGLGRGLDHVKACLGLPDVEIAYLCDVDDRRIARAIEEINKSKNKPAKMPQTVKDFRRVLDDKSVDAITIAAPNFWHAPAAILACAAGKHVYVEKPGSHNPREGELMVAAARKHDRVVQMGNQRRSSVRTWYSNSRKSIGVGKPVPVPAELDYSLWQGPVPERPYVDNLVHYNWHWRWHYGGGELANNGPHALDLARWGLGVDCPTRVTCGGGRYHFKDDQQTPDTTLVSFDFGDKAAFFDASSCQPRTAEKLNFVTFYGDHGSLAIGWEASYVVYDPKGKEVDKGKSEGGDRVHFANFFDSLRAGKRPHSDIAEGQKSTLLCHLGNIAYRTGHTLTLDPAARKIIGDAEAAALWGREYRPGWEPKV